MGKKSRPATKRFVSTSVHLPYEYLERMDELGEPHSSFVREAVKEKLEREEGYLAAIQRQKDVTERLRTDLKMSELTLADFEVKHEEWKVENERIRVRDIIITEYLTGVYHKQEDLFELVQKQVKTTSEIDLSALVKEVWKDLRGEETNEFE